MKAGDGPKKWMMRREEACRLSKYARRLVRGASIESVSGLFQGFQGRCVGKSEVAWTLVREFEMGEFGHGGAEPSARCPSAYFTVCGLLPLRTTNQSIKVGDIVGTYYSNSEKNKR